MRIFAAMATCAILGQFLRGHRCAVTSVAVDFCVSTDQREFGLRRMVIDRRPPALIVMAVGAGRAEARSMRIVGLVAAVAVLGDLVLVVPAAVTSQAVDLRVNAEQFIAGFLEMVVLRRLPFLGRMAFCAVRAARSAMLIIGRMTAIAARRGLSISAADVTRIAAQHDVRSGQLEIGFVVLEPASGPAHAAVALAAGLSELSAMHVVRFVAPDARRGRLAPAFVGLVAALAVERSVSALQRKVAEMMIELGAIQLHDIGLAALVFRVAGAAFTGSGIAHSAVIAALLAHIAGDILVAVQAQ